MKKLCYALLSGLMVSNAYAIGFDISIGAYKQDPSGTVKYKGDKIDVEKDLGLEEHKGAFTRLKFEHPIFFLPNVYFQHMPMKFDGKTRLQRSITYGNTTYQANSDVSSSFKVNRYDVALYRGIPLVGLVGIDPEIGINARIMEFDGKITGTTNTGTVTKSKSATVFVPMIYAGLGLNVPVIPISARGELRILHVSKLKYQDWSAELRVKPIKPIYASVGYRSERLKLDDISDIFTDLKTKGVYATVGLEF